MDRVPRLANAPAAPVVRSPAAFMALPFQNPVCVDEQFLIDCGFLDRFRQVMEQGRWSGLLTLQTEADKEDTAEFLGTFTFDGLANGAGISYRFRGQRYWCTLARMREVFGWAEPEGNAFCKYITDAAQMNVWFELTGARSFNPSETSARRMRDPFWFYMQFILSRTVTARTNGNDKPKRLDIQMIGHLMHGLVPDWAYVICEHWKTLRVTGTVRVGGMVTYLLRRLHPEIQARPTDTIYPCESADRYMVKSGRTFRIRSNGAIQWTYCDDPDFRPREVTPPRPRGRPPVRGGGGRRRRRAAMEDEEPLDVVPPEDDQMPQQQHFQHPPVPPEELTIVFHYMRSVQMAAYGYIPRVPPPPGWQPGLPIPPEYLQPDFQPPPPPED